MMHTIVNKKGYHYYKKLLLQQLNIKLHTIWKSLNVSDDLPCSGNELKYAG